MDHLDRLQQPTHERAPPPAPPGPLCFLVFVFPRPPAASGPPGRPLTVESKTLRPAKTLAEHNNAQNARDTMLERGYTLRVPAPRVTPKGQEHIKYFWDRQGEVAKRLSAPAQPTGFQKELCTGGTRQCRVAAHVVKTVVSCPRHSRVAARHSMFCLEK